MHTPLRAALAIAGLAIATQAAAQVTVYEHEGFGGRSFTTQRAVGDFNRYGFNDRASSVLVSRDRWEVCEDAGFRGRCVVLRQGSYPSLRAMGLNDRVSSVRAVNRNARVEDDRYAPPPVVAHDYRRRRNERLYQAEVTDVRAVLGPPERRCWVERQEVPAGTQRRQCARGAARRRDRRHPGPPGRRRHRPRHRHRGRRRGRRRHRLQRRAATAAARPSAGTCSAVPSGPPRAPRTGT